MAKMPKEVIDLFNDPQASKVLATVDAAGNLNMAPTGNLNVAPKGSLATIDEETIAFADVFGGKTKENLEATRKTAVVVFKMPPVGYQVKGTFQGFQASGALFDRFAKMVKEAARMETKAVGVIKVEEVYSVSPCSICLRCPCVF